MLLCVILVAISPTNIPFQSALRPINAPQVRQKKDKTECTSFIRSFSSDSSDLFFFYTYKAQVRLEIEFDSGVAYYPGAVTVSLFFMLYVGKRGTLLKL